MGNDSEKGKYECTEGSKTWEYLATFSCSILMLCIGSSLGWNSPASFKFLDENSPDRMEKSEVTILMMLMALGQIFAPPVNYFIVDRIGRRNTLLVCGMPLILSWTLMSTNPNNFYALFVARLAAGLSLGIGLCVAYMYIGEIASTSIRGMANTFLVVMFNLGILLAYVIGPTFSLSEVAFFNLLLTIAFVGLISFMPESPHFLLMAGLNEDAEEILMKFRGKSDVSEELLIIEDSLNQQSRKTSISDILSDPACFKGICIIGIFSVTHQFGGYIPIVSFGANIFNDITTDISNHTANVTLGAVQLLAVVMITLLVDRVNRKVLIVTSGVASGFFNLMVAIYFYYKDFLKGEDQCYAIMAVICVFLVIFSFNCGIVIVQSILLSEVFAADVKALGTCIATINGGILFFISSSLYTPVTKTWEFGHFPVFFLFVIVIWGGTVVLWYITPETKGRSLPEIQKKLINKKLISWKSNER